MQAANLVMCLPSAKFMEPAKTRAANSPTLKPAAATHVSIAWGKKTEN